ncbi:MAG: DNA modification methylase [Acidimicrobiaceae bacterium]|nr:DNA modification methylase [Acidimicrobiaceae bacterium]MXW76759.1 DNA modification methylase [Acidimicrobiaceae bacterium]MYA74825.1 DNA modification methylase [Acidimicrobiaceae bacterium]MYC43448.1 DNA modification methylase [Acidimicrobiaceae bacterium]MYD06851.1 DNA modification methylase [Acidimicrobiaceae bacterium]
MGAQARRARTTGPRTTGLDGLGYEAAVQLSLLEPPGTATESPAYYQQQVITYIGNKRQLLTPISDALKSVRAESGRDSLHLFDGFAGSGIVSRLFKAYAERVVSNDLEPYARVVANCFLANRSDVELETMGGIVEKANRLADEATLAYPGFIERMYAPEDDSNIRLGERVFYTRENARRLDWFRQFIGQQQPSLHDLLLGPLLSSASVHANTAGVFKGFYKDKHTGIGKFGGSGADALTRIKGQIRLQTPVLSRFETEVEVYQQDVNKLISDIGGFDLAYFDPPYNQHPYGSNYFMLNLLVDYSEPKDVSAVSGIPTGWNRSHYNKKRHAFDQLSDAVSRVDARYVLLSFNDDGFVGMDQLRRFLAMIGHVEERKLRYNTFRGSRNLRSRNIHVNEHLFLVRKRA